MVSSCNSGRSRGMNLVPHSYPDMHPNLVLSRKWVREVDRRAVEEYGIPSLILMENAGRGVADLLSRLGIGGPVVVICGRGNNAGDGFVIARHLDLRGFSVSVLLCSDSRALKGDAEIHFQILRRSGVPIRELNGSQFESAWTDAIGSADWIVDAMLGTGASGPVRPPLDDVVLQINQAGNKVLAVDLPSGLDCDEGPISQPIVRANATATFVAMKPGFLMPGAAEFTGQVHVLDIGAPRKLLEDILHEMRQNAMWTEGGEPEARRQ